MNPPPRTGISRESGSVMLRTGPRSSPSAAAPGTGCGGAGLGAGQPGGGGLDPAVLADRHRRLASGHPAPGLAGRLRASLPGRGLGLVAGDLTVQLRLCSRDPRLPGRPAATAGLDAAPDTALACWSRFCCAAARSASSPASALRIRSLRVTGSASSSGSSSPRASPNSASSAASTASASARICRGQLPQPRPRCGWRPSTRWPRSSSRPPRSAPACPSPAAAAAPAPRRTAAPSPPGPRNAPAGTARRRMIGDILRADHPERHILAARPLDPPRRPHPHRVPVRQQPQQHPRSYAARPATDPRCVWPGREPRRCPAPPPHRSRTTPVTSRQPLPHIRRQHST